MAFWTRHSGVSMAVRLDAWTLKDDRGDALAKPFDACALAVLVTGHWGMIFTLFALFLQCIHSYGDLW